MSPTNSSGCRQWIVLAGGSLLGALVIGCGGSSSETPFPLEPVPDSEQEEDRPPDPVAEPDEEKDSKGEQSESELPPLQSD